MLFSSVDTSSAWRIAIPTNSFIFPIESSLASIHTFPRLFNIKREFHLPNSTRHTIIIFSTDTSQATSTTILTSCSIQILTTSACILQTLPLNMRCCWDLYKACSRTRKTIIFRCPFTCFTCWITRLAITISWPVTTFLTFFITSSHYWCIHRNLYISFPTNPTILRSCNWTFCAHGIAFFACARRILILMFFAPCIALFSSISKH